MKVRCGNCKKSFDPEKHGDFCPYCGMFYNEGFNAGVETKKQWKKPENEGIQEKSPKPAKKKRKVSVYVVVLAILILLPLLATPVGRVAAKASYERNRKGAMEAQYYEVGESIDVQHHTVKIVNAQWLDGTANVNVPEGHRLLEVTYEAKADVGGVHLDSLSYVYLHCDGQYLKAMVMDGVKSSGSVYYSPSICHQTGIFGFVVPEDAENVELVFQVQSDILKAVAKFKGTYAVKIEK